MAAEEVSEPFYREHQALEGETNEPTCSLWYWGWVRIPQRGSDPLNRFSATISRFVNDVVMKSRKLSLVSDRCNTWYAINGIAIAFILYDIERSHIE